MTRIWKGTRLPCGGHCRFQRLYIQWGWHFSTALDSVLVQGVAPDAQLLVMKVFGQNGGAYDSDYMAAIEGRHCFGCGFCEPVAGFHIARLHPGEAYQEVMDRLTESDTVVVISAGNAGHWADNGFHGKKGYLYAEDVDMYTGGSPRRLSQCPDCGLCGQWGCDRRLYFSRWQTDLYNETAYKNLPLRSLAGEHEYVFLDSWLRI